eukprot:c27207_g1_i1.p2 GENE.c27207_g1_i1~~c27207_g1_i1.p2  ORF type:complete len:144 (+),score=44.94 c27207_g1_i1:27-458(+)
MQKASCVLLLLLVAEATAVFTCNNGKQIPNGAKLDGVCDCSDGSDEVKGWCANRADVSWAAHECSVTTQTVSGVPIPLMSVGLRRGLAIATTMPCTSLPTLPAHSTVSVISFQCSANSFISRAFVNDGYCDCANKADEVAGTC